MLQFFSLIFDGLGSVAEAHTTQNSQQKSVPDLNVLTVAFLPLKKYFFLKKKIPFFNAAFQFRCCGVFKKIRRNFFDHEKVKKRA